MKRKTLKSFIPPLYADARTGKIIIEDQYKEAIDERLNEIIKMADNKEQASMNTTNDTTTLPELRGGELLLNPRSGKTYRVHRVNKPKRDQFLEPIYRLENVVLGSQEWTLDELQEQGLRKME